MRNRFANKLAGISVCVELLLLIWVVFGKTLQHGFVNYDDDFYVFANPQVTGGLTRHAIATAFTHSDLFLWTPLTRISHVLDVQLFGLRPAGHHLTNLLLHAAATVLLFVALQKMTGALWRNAFVAAVFAIHPLHVESVAWISERKDVLSGVFFMLTLLAYIYYARKPSSLSRYLPVVLFFLLGLLSKPMLVTVPFVLLLLDYWPLQRFNLTNQAQYNIGRPSLAGLRAIPLTLIREKIPLFLLSAASLAIAIFDPFKWNGTDPDFVIHPLVLRVQNAIVSYAIYIWQMFCPRDLAIRYPFPENGLPAWQVFLSLGLLIVITAAAFRERKRRPYLLVGWLWYVGMLLPVIGIVEAGGEAHSDRYTYLPQLGLYLLIAWLVNDLTKTWRWRRQILGASMCAILLALTLSARAQVSYWRTNESLWTHTLAITPDNWHAENNLCGALLAHGKVELARSHAAEALRIRPDYPEAHMNLGVALVRLGRTVEALEEMKKACALRPNSPLTHYNLGSALTVAGRIDEAIPHFSEALRLNPNSLQTLKALGWIRATQPDPADRNADEALQLATRAVQITGSQDPVTLDLLAAALAQAGRFEEAIKVAERAQALAAVQNQPVIARQINEHLDFYRLGLPYLTKSRRSNEGAFDVH